MSKKKYASWVNRLIQPVTLQTESITDKSLTFDIQKAILSTPYKMPPKVFDSDYDDYDDYLDDDTSCYGSDLAVIGQQITDLHTSAGSRTSVRVASERSEYAVSPNVPPMAVSVEAESKSDEDVGRGHRRKAADGIINVDGVRFSRID